MKKNILFLMADQFAYHALGCLGSCAKTPNLDRIAAGAVNFANCYTNSPPVHAGTGLSGHRPLSGGAGHHG